MTTALKFEFWRISELGSENSVFVMRKLSSSLVIINYDVCIREEETALRFKQPNWTRSIRNVRSYLLELGQKLGKFRKYT